ncbi:ABC transporter permease [Pseudonocardia eucalypti]|uniref:ABC transporter permease n=2 Tax=Pseudonocardia eucalypti TaxID=648755 RepID=A0ABP9QE21_9PSEU|nr:phospholipid/cholesterol/gamma-HCH transport system permease protein [Pseudonocardia eucalypti]
MDLLQRYGQNRLGGLVGTVLGRIYDGVVTAGKIFVMAVDVVVFLVRDTLRGQFQFKETITQAWFIVRVSVAPTLLVAVPFGVIISVQIGSLASQVGATSFIGAANGLGVIRQGAPTVVALLLAGTVGSAICSDLGARTIREEIDALETLGISPIQRLVAPRVVATTVIALLLCGVVAFAGVLTGFLFNMLAQNGTPGSYISSFAAFALPSDLILAEVKSGIFGAMVGVVACYKGLDAKGGPKGVADAVNASVVLSVVLLFAVNVIITQIYAVISPPRLG